jgi:hypothetical protein
MCQRKVRQVVHMRGVQQLVSVPYIKKGLQKYFRLVAKCGCSRKSTDMMDVRAKLIAND